MKIGVVPYLMREGGGCYQYSGTVLQAIDEIASGSREDEFILLPQGEAPVEVMDPWLPHHAVRVQPFHSMSLMTRRLLHRVPGGFSLIEIARRLDGQRCRRHPDQRRMKPRISRWLRRQGIEILLFVTCRPLAFELDLPYIVIVQDLIHRLIPDLPEVSARGEWHRREHLYRNSIRHALRVVVDSVAGRDDVLRFYSDVGASEEKIRLLPYVAPSYLRGSVGKEFRETVRTRYNLPERYLFYPAQFLAHKNHEVIVRALAELSERESLRLPLVLSGCREGPIHGEIYRRVMGLAKELGVESLIRPLGYVPDDDMPGLYAGAAALVMPTFYGPTVLPILEAWSASIPAITADVRGMREFTGEAAMRVDPLDAAALAAAIRRVWSDASLSDRLIRAGRAKVEGWGPAEFRDRLRGILDDAKRSLTGKGDGKYNPQCFREGSLALQ